MNEKQKIMIVIVLIFALTLPKLYVLLINDICLHWDCSFYIYAVKYGQPKNTNASPFVFMLIPFAQIFGAVETVKAVMIIMNLVFLFGFYILLKDRISFKMTLFAMVLAGMSLGITRIWVDTYKNFFVLMLSPYLFYLILKKKYLLSGILLGFMMTNHEYSFIFLPVFLVYFLVTNYKKEWKKHVMFFAIAFFIYVSYSLSMRFIGYQHLGVDYLAVWVTRYYNAGFEGLMENFAWVVYFNSGMIPVVFIAIFSKKRDKLQLLSFILFLMLFFTLFTNITMIRGTVLITLPMIILVSFFLNDTKKVIRIIFVLALFSYVIYGFYSTFEAHQDTSSSEIAFFKAINIPNDSLVITSGRSYFVMKFFTEDKYNVVGNNFYGVLGQQDKKDVDYLHNSTFFNETEYAVGSVKKNYNVSYFFVYLNRDLDFHTNDTVKYLKDISIEMKEANPELMVML